MKNYTNGYILGVSIGDGYFYEEENRIQLTTKDKEFAEKFRKELEKFSSKEASLYEYNYYEVKCWLGSPYIKERERDLHNQNLEKKPKEYIKGIADGLFDSEGSIFIHNKLPVIKYGTTSEKEAELYKKCIELLNIETNTNFSEPLYYVSITNKKNYKKFIEKLNPIIERKTKKYYEWRDNYSSTYNKWSDKEIDILKEKYPSQGSDIKKLRNNDRTGDDIRTKANNLGITKGDKN